jgi:hypothetical protein
MVLQLQVWAFWLFQEAQAEGIQFDVRSVWGNMGFIDRRHDRSFNCV